MSDVIN